MKTDIKSLLLNELKEYFESIGDKTYRAEQVFSWLHNGVTAFSEMTNISVKLREKLDNDFTISIPALIEKQTSKSDGSVKYLWQMKENDAVESVLMGYVHGYTICISTQVGCRMGCAFCASAIGGLERNLLASEMLDQVLYSQNDSGKRISNVVLMGIGEPLDNFENTMRFLEIISHPSGINIGARHITLSTCGVVENIDRLAQYDVQSTLAISLHAPDDETRNRLIPYNQNVGVKKLIDAGSRYFSKTGRRITYEYAMINEVNDSPNQAALLAQLLRGTESHLNLIQLSKIHERDLTASAPDRVERFTGILRKNGVNFTIRRSLGADIEASCGQLRRRRYNKSL